MLLRRRFCNLYSFEALPYHDFSFETKALNCYALFINNLMFSITMKKFQIVALGITILPFALNAANSIEADGVASNTNYPETESATIDSAINLQEVTVQAHFAKANHTPLNLTTIKPADIIRHQSAPNYLEMFQGIPGVYATASTGSYGDATLNMRGFKQDNISIMLNGIPIQGLTSGSMYWSNWMGLADATYSVQVQKGLGASMLADCAMGGMVNIVTKNAGYTPHADVTLSTTQWGTKKASIGFSSGLIGNGWSVNANLSYVGGGSYVECSDVKTFSYLISVSKSINDTFTLVFTALGSPEKHDQRNTELSKEEVDRYGRDYSKNWGYYNGKKYSIGHNHYIKPYFTLQHLMNSERLKMKNSIYLAIADGGGSSTYNNYKLGVPTIIQHQTADGHIDFNAIVAENQADGVSKNVMIDYLSGHTQFGAISSADYRLTDVWTASAGLQYQYYATCSKMKLLDMLGGTTFTDPSTNASLSVGDYVGSRYGRTTHHASAFVQGRYTTDKVNANLGISVFNGNYRRRNNATGETSKWAHGWGASIKGGVLWNANRNNALYINAGYNSRLPYAGVFLASSDLSITNDITNETNIVTEIGWRPKWKNGGMELSGYVASWRNKTLTVSAAKQANAAAEKYQVKGLNALHMGVEFSAYQYLTHWLKTSAYAMMGSWKWKNSGRAITYNHYSGETLKETKISCDGLHVGDAPQTQLGAQIDAKLPKGIYANIDWQYNAHMYADFEPASRTNENDKADSYEFPSYSLFDATVGWKATISKGLRINIFATARNLFDAKYIERGTDGASHDIDTFRGYWGAARTLSAGMRLSF